MARMRAILKMILPRAEPSDLPALRVSPGDAGRLARGQAVLLRGRDAPVIGGWVSVSSHGSLIGLLDADGRCVFGATVELEDENTGERVRYQIVGEDEADLKLGLINISSPIARALIGKEEGDLAEVQAPGGVRRYEIVSVQYL